MQVISNTNYCTSSYLIRAQRKIRWKTPGACTLCSAPTLSRPFLFLSLTKPSVWIGPVWEKALGTNHWLFSFYFSQTKKQKHCQCKRGRENRHKVNVNKAENNKNVSLKKSGAQEKK